MVMIGAIALVILASAEQISIGQLVALLYGLSRFESVTNTFGWSSATLIRGLVYDRPSTRLPCVGLRTALTSFVVAERSPTSIPSGRPARWPQLYLIREAKDLHSLA